MRLFKQAGFSNAEKDPGFTEISYKHSGVSPWAVFPDQTRLMLSGNIFQTDPNHFPFSTGDIS